MAIWTALLFTSNMHFDQAPSTLFCPILFLRWPDRPTIDHNLFSFLFNGPYLFVLIWLKLYLIVWSTYRIYKYKMPHTQSGQNIELNNDLRSSLALIMIVWYWRIFALGTHYWRTPSLLFRHSFTSFPVIMHSFHQDRLLLV